MNFIGPILVNCNFNRFMGNTFRRNTCMLNISLLIFRCGFKFINEMINETHEIEHTDSNDSKNVSPLCFLVLGSDWGDVPSESPRPPAKSFRWQNFRKIVDVLIIFIFSLFYVNTCFLIWLNTLWIIYLSPNILLRQFSR